MVSQLSKEAKDLGDRIFGTPEDDYDFGMTLNLIEEVTELRKRFVEIKSSSSTNLFDPIEITVGFEVIRSELGELLQKSRVKLYNIKENLNETKRAKESISKIKATELGKNLP